jgi:hypothetical protein
MSDKKSVSLSDLDKVQEQRRNAVDKFADLGSKSSIKESFDEVEDLIGQIIFNDQIRLLDINNEKSHELQVVNTSDNSKGKDLESSSDNSVEKYIEQMDLTPEQIDLLQKEFDKIMQELLTLLAEIGGLLSELGSPPDPQKLALLKAKMQLLRALRSRMTHFSLMAGPKYQKVFNVKHYVAQIQAFVKENEPQLKQLGIDANLLDKDSTANNKLELILDKQKTLESLLEQLNKLEKELDGEKDPKKLANLTIQINQLKERILALEKDISADLEASDISNEEGKEKGKASAKGDKLEGAAAEEELELEEAAAGMFAELNGLINGQRFGQYQLLAGESMNVHKTFAQLLDYFDIGGQELQNVREADIEKTQVVENIVKTGAAIEAAKDVTNLVEDVASSAIDLDVPGLLP